jgi:uncharacterized flavoprotein (TIGR03862 family)
LSKEKVIVVGGGPGGLFCAYHLLKKGFEVDLYDQMSGVGKKFLVAGNGGLNLTHSEEIDIFSTRYGKNASFFFELLESFSPNDLRDWCNEIGVETFIGSSGRVFPKKLNAADILLKWIEKLKSNPKFQIFLKHQLIKVSKEKVLSFKKEEELIEVKGPHIILALGGANWEKTGSDGKWKEMLENLEIKVEPFLPMNCGFERPWSDFFISNIERSPLKNIALEIDGRKVKGEVMLTPFGIEGGGIYALSDLIRDEIIRDGKSQVVMDLRPNLNDETILNKIMAKRKGDSLSNHLRKTLRLGKVEFILLKEILDSETMNDSQSLAKSIKRLKLDLFATRPLNEAISTSGGVKFNELTKNLEVKSIPGLFIVGEMLDFDAPTGGYLLQGCFSTAMRVVSSIMFKK